jgi:hypothetical protein
VAAAVSKSNALGVGIAIGGAFIGAGLYFGLRARAPEPVIASAPLVAPTTTVASATAVAAENPGRAAPTIDVATARAEVVRQLEAVRASLRDQCWAPSLARNPNPDHGSFTFQYTFDASGQQVARGISADQGRTRADAAFCLTGKTPNVTITPQGASVRMTLSLAFP